MFADRVEAGKRLAKELASYAGPDTVVLALPRGGVVLGSVIAQTLHVPLDIIVTRKIGHPYSPEYALGAVDEDGTFLHDQVEARAVDGAWLIAEVKRQQHEARRRSQLYRQQSRPLGVRGKTVILVDDGIATGFTMQLAVARVLQLQPARLIVAVPAASAEVVNKLSRVVDEVIVLEPPEHFRGSVGAYYEQFPQVSDEEVIRLMEVAQEGGPA